MASPEDSPLRLNRRFSPFVPRQRAQEPVAAGRFFLCVIRPHGACRAADCEKPPGATRTHRPLRASLCCFVGDAALFSAATAPKRHQLCMFYPKHESVLACVQIAVDSCNIACCSQHSVHKPIFNQKDTFGSPKNYSFKIFHKINTILFTGCRVWYNLPRIEAYNDTMRRLPRRHPPSARIVRESPHACLQRHKPLFSRCPQEKESVRSFFPYRLFRLPLFRVSRFTVCAAVLWHAPSSTRFS